MDSKQTSQDGLISSIQGVTKQVCLTGGKVMKDSFPEEKTTEFIVYNDWKSVPGRN